MGIVRNRLFENPDYVIYNDTRYAYYDDSYNPMPFGFYKGKLVIREGNTHGSIPAWQEIRDKLKNKHANNYWDPREILQYTGRLWRDPKIISFWQYPPKNEFKEIIDKIGKAIGQPNMFNDPEWKVEIITNKKDYDDNDNVKLKVIDNPVEVKNDDWDNGEYITEIIPLKNYVGSGQRSKQELAQQHIASPMDKNKTQRPGRSDFFKVRDKKEKPLAWKQAMYAESYVVRPTINESPDSIEADNLYDVAGKDEMGYSSEDSLNPFPFGYIDGKIRVGEAGELKTHYNISQYYDDLTPGSAERIKHKYGGRAWIDSKIISFWNYPKTKNELYKVLEDIQNEYQRLFPHKKQPLFFDGDWYIEVIVEKLPDNVPRGDVEGVEGAWAVAKDAKLIPISQYKSSANQSATAQGKAHVASPMSKSKMKRPDRSDFFKVRDKKEKPLAWKQAMYAESLDEQTLNEKLLIGEPISIEELRDLLHNKVINFEFIKLDGEVRPVRGTTMMKYVPKDQQPTGENPSSDKVAAFYDLSKGEWRSVSNRSDEIVVKRDEKTGKPKIVVSDKKPKEEPKKSMMPKEKDVEQRPIKPTPKPIVSPSIRPEKVPPLPSPDEIEDVEPETPLNIEDPNTRADEVDPEEIIAPEPEVPQIEEPEDEEPSQDYDEEKDVSSSSISKEDITFPPPEEDITFPDEEEDEEDES